MADLLLVATDPELHHLMELFAQAHGHAFRVVESEAQALAAVTQHLPDVLVTTLPLMGPAEGRELLALLGRKPRGRLVPVFFILGWAPHSRDHFLFQTSAHRFPAASATLAPLDCEELFDHLADAIDRVDAAPVRLHLCPPVATALAQAAP